MEWQQMMSLGFLALGTYIVYLYLTGKIRLGPGGQEWDGKVSTSTSDSACPPPDCDCGLLRARINYLDRKLHDTENALLKAEGLYASLYTKYVQLLQTMEEWKARALKAEGDNTLLRKQVQDLQAELGACRAELEGLRARCLERAEHTSCSPGLSLPGTLLR